MFLLHLNISTSCQLKQFSVDPQNESESLFQTFTNVLYIRVYTE